MIDHLSIAVSDLARSAAFYAMAPRPLGHMRLGARASYHGAFTLDPGGAKLARFPQEG